MSEKISDRELVLQLQSGSLEALGTLYDRHRQLVYRTALAIISDTDSAADLLQDVFLRLHRFARNIDPSRPLEPWLYRMTINLTYDWIKRRNRLPRPLEGVADWLVGTGKNPPYEAVERNDEWRQVQKAIAALPLPQRIVITLYYLNDLSLKEIADILDVPVGTVKSRLYYGRIALKTNLGLDKEMASDLNYERP
ncbi:MAG: RNA polymerase sigma factor [Anaerolineales bacterium]|nr:RNA polymerase sigma factor [Anaerolineales bacterium]